jgi:hypothetical protein
MEMASTTSNCNSSSFSLLPPTLKEDEISGGVKPSGILLFSVDIISSGLIGSYWVIAKILSLPGRALHYPT